MKTIISDIKIIWRKLVPGYLLVLVDYHPSMDGSILNILAIYMSISKNTMIVLFFEHICISPRQRWLQWFKPTSLCSYFVAWLVVQGTFWGCGADNVWFVDSYTLDWVLVEPPLEGPGRSLSCCWSSTGDRHLVWSAGTVLCHEMTYGWPMVDKL